MSGVRYSVTSSISHSPERLPKEDNKGRLQKIEQKLQTITIQRHNQLKEDAQELITKRVLQLETKATEDAKFMESQVHNLKDELCQLKVRENEQNKKYQLSRKNRQIEIL